MKKLTIPILLLTGLSACQNKKEMTGPEVKARVDSLVGLRMKDMNQWAQEDLEQRMTIELRSRTDSIIQARQTPVDTSKARQTRRAMDSTHRRLQGEP
jgi:predicted DNA-binding protein (UPF0251 family)